MKPNDEKQKQLEKEVEELRAQLQRKEEDDKVRLADIARKDEEAKLKDELLRKREEELRRLRRQPSESLECMEEGSFEWEVEKEDIGEEPIFSPPNSVAGIPFRISCRLEDEMAVTTSYIYNQRQETKSLIKYLVVSIDLDPTEKTAKNSVILSCTLALASTKNSPCSHMKNNFILHSMAKWEMPKFIQWSNAVDPSKGYIKDGRLTIKADIKIICHYKNSMANFGSPDPLLSDVTLLVGEEAFHVSKTYLAHFSKYFKVIFFSDCAEKDKDEVELTEVNAKEFDELLRMIHPQRVKTKVTKDNVEYILRLADFFDIQLVIWDCIVFLKDSTDFSPAAKLQLTDQYQLPELQYDVLEKIRDKAVAKTIVDSAVYKKFSQTLKIQVLEKLVKYV